jgi:hypothetical protein
MRQLVLLALLALATKSYSQVIMLGKTEDEIKNCKGIGRVGPANLPRGYAKDTKTVVYIVPSNKLEVQYFVSDSSGKCTMMCVLPKNNKALDMMIARLEADKNVEAISSANEYVTMWEGKRIEIRLHWVRYKDGLLYRHIKMFTYENIEL